MTPEEQYRREQGLKLANQMTSKLFYYEPIKEVERIRELAPFQTEAEFQDYLKHRPGRIFCGDCSKMAEHWELMHTDPLYKRGVCTQCRDKAIMQRIKNFQNRGKDPNEGHYSITAAQARANAKKVEHNVH